MPNDLTGYAPPTRTLVDQYTAAMSPNYTDYSGYGGLHDMGPGNATGSGYSPATQAAVNARNSSGMSTRDIYGQDGQLVSHDVRATPERSGAANAPAFQDSAFMDDPFYQRSDVIPAISATNRDTLGGGHFGIRGWMNDHPGGTLAAFIAAAAGGAALAPAGVGAGAAGGTAGAGTGAGTAGVGFGGAGTAGIPANLAADFAGTTVGGGAAGNLAAAGGIAGGAGTGIGGSLGGSGILSQQSLGNIQQLSGLLGGGKSSGGGSQPIPYIQPVLGNQQMPQQTQTPTPMLGAPQEQMPYIPSRGYRARNFMGATIWS